MKVFIGEDWRRNRSAWPQAAGSIETCVQGEEAVDVAVERGHKASIARNGDRADGTGGAGVAAGADSAWAAANWWLGEEGKPACACFAAGEGGDKIEVRDAEATEGFQDVRSRFRLRR